jgi:hypothetical protein
MIIGQGRGGLVALTIFATSLLENLISDQIGKGYYNDHQWVPGVFISLSSFLYFCSTNGLI